MTRLAHLASDVITNSITLDGCELVNQIEKEMTS